MKPSAMMAPLFAASLATLAVATPVLAKTKPIVIPASVFQNEDSKLCMSKDVLAKLADKETLKTMPATVCDTQSGREGRGVEFKLK
jgi:hypothetical protein